MNDNHKSSPEEFWFHLCVSLPKLTETSGEHSVLLTTQGEDEGADPNHHAISAVAVGGL